MMVAKVNSLILILLDPGDSYTSPMNSTEIRKFDEVFAQSLKY